MGRLPDGLWVLVVLCESAIDGGLELGNRSDDTALDCTS
jgi:hypothetical protein